MSIIGMQNNVERYLCCKQLKFTLNTVAYLFNLITLQYLPCHVQYCTINSTEKSMFKNFPLSTSKNHMKKYLIEGNTVKFSGAFLQFLYSNLNFFPEKKSQIQENKSWIQGN